MENYSYEGKPLRKEYISDAIRVLEEWRQEREVPGDYKGLYQFINQSFASILPEKYKTINREQYLGDEGLRQAKVTYRPVGFAKKYRACIGAASTPSIA